jgi:hypothetical protein
MLYECELVNNHSLTHLLTKLIFLHPTTLLDTLFDFLPTSDITHQLKNTNAISSLDMKTQGLSNYHHSLILLSLSLTPSALIYCLFEHSNRQELPSHRHHIISYLTAWDSKSTVMIHSTGRAWSTIWVSSCLILISASSWASLCRHALCLMVWCIHLTSSLCSV